MSEDAKDYVMSTEERHEAIATAFRRAYPGFTIARIAEDSHTDYAVTVDLSSARLTPHVRFTVHAEQLTPNAGRLRLRVTFAGDHDGLRVINDERTIG